jgi:hypothetical protein
LRRDAELREHRDPGPGHRGDGLGIVGGAVEFHHVDARLFDQPDGRFDRSVGPLLQGAEREVTADDGPLNAAPHRPADHDHLGHRHL